MPAVFGGTTHAVKVKFGEKRLFHRCGASPDSSDKLSLLVHRELVAPHHLIGGACEADTAQAISTVDSSRRSSTMSALSRAAT